jgi:type II restriction enzyme
LSIDKTAKVSTALAIPYNPYYPKPYARWTSGGIYDSTELLVGPNFWDFIAGESVYDELLKVFKEVGDELRPMIDSKVGY